MRKRLTLLLLVLNSAIGLSQTDSLITRNIEIKSYVIDSEIGNRISKEKFELDSIRIKTKRYDNKIKAECEFDNSGLELQAEYYFRNDILILVRFTEISEGFKKYDAKKVTEFYYSDGKKIDEKVQSFIPGILAELGIPKDTDKAFGYNKNWTTDFLNELAEQILRKTYE